jgi:hypothetical protein
VLVEWSVTAGSGKVYAEKQYTVAPWHLHRSVVGELWCYKNLSLWVGGEGGRLLVSGLSPQGVTLCCREAVHSGTVAHVPQHRRPSNNLVVLAQPYQLKASIHLCMHSFAHALNHILSHSSPFLPSFVPQASPPSERLWA